MWPLLGPKQPTITDNAVATNDPGHTHQVGGILGGYSDAETRRQQHDALLRAMASQYVNAAGVNSGAAPSKEPKSLRTMTEVMLKQAIAMRLRYEGVSSIPVDFMSAYAISDDKVIVLVVRDQQHTVLEDGVMFPSDTFISQLRLILAA